MFKPGEFFRVLRAHFGPLSKPQVAALEPLTNALLAAWTDRRWVAYALATVWHETGATCECIPERGRRAYFNKYEAGTRKGAELGNTQPGDGYLFRGRTWPQITGRGNYATFDRLLGLNGELLANPDILLERPPQWSAMDPAARDAWARRARELSAKILIIGMESGRFTGKRLGHYFDGKLCDRIGARRIINGQDKAEVIAGYAVTFEKAIDAGMAVA